MAGVALVGFFGDKEIVRDQFLSTTVRKEEWKGSQCYQHAHFVELPISGVASDLVSSLPRDLVRYTRTPEKSSSDIFQLENDFLEAFNEQERKREEEQSAREARQKEMDAALKVTREQRAERKKQQEEKRREEEEAQQKKIEEMRDVTGANAQLCKSMLEKSDWNVAESTRLYFEHPSQQPVSSEVYIIFHMLSTGTQQEYKFRETTTVFELYQTVFQLLPDQSRGFDMLLNGRPLGEMEFSFPLKAVGLQAGQQKHKIVIRYN